MTWVRAFSPKKHQQLDLLKVVALDKAEKLITAMVMYGNSNNRNTKFHILQLYSGSIRLWQMWICSLLDIPNLSHSQYQAR